MNLSVCQPVSQSISQSASQSVSLSVSQSGCQSMCQSISRSVRQCASQLVCQSSKQHTNKPASQQSTNQSFSQSNNSPINQLNNPYLPRMKLPSTAVFWKGVKGKQRPFDLQLCASHGRTFAWHFRCGLIDGENAPHSPFASVSVCDLRVLRHGNGSRAYFEIKTSRWSHFYGNKSR